MERWIIGASGIEAVGDRLRVQVGSKHRQVFTGEVVERGPRRLVRRYTLDRVHTGPVSFGAGGVYARTVTYLLAPALEGCALTCSVVTEIDGLPKAAIGPGSKAEARSLRRSLERLQLGVEQRRVGLLRRSRDGNQVPQPL
jgi:hypothetical protein